MERKGSCHLCWELSHLVCLVTEFDNTDLVEKQGMNVISFSLCWFNLSVCIGFAYHACPWFSALKFLKNLCWNFRGKDLTPPPPTLPTPSSHHSTDFFPSPLLTSSIHGWEGGARRGVMGTAPPMWALAQGEDLPPIPFATVPSPLLPFSYTSCQPNPLPRPGEG